MNVVVGPPPNYEAIKKAFILHGGIVFTFGSVLYNPDGTEITPTLMAHEEVHGEQQEEYGVERWWRRYLRDPPFRLSQEIPAYQAQYKEACRLVKDRNRRAEYAGRLARSLSSPMYGSIISQHQAYDAIRKEKPFAFNV